MIRSGSIHSSIRGHRAFITQAFAVGSARMRLFEKLLSVDGDKGVSVKLLDAEESEELTRLHYRGRLWVSGDVYRFWTPLHHDYYR